jgi:hypothetical protein
VLCVDVKKFQDQGYLHIRNVFGDAEVEEFRRRVFEVPPWQGDLLSHPHLRNALLNDRVLSVGAQILGDTPVYFGDSGFTVGQQSYGFHKDNADRLDGSAPDWQGTYSLIRFGLYLQDHSWHSGGLRIRPGSHHAVSCPTCRPMSVRTRLGDLVVWNLRTDHAGNATLLRFFPWFYVERRYTGNWVPRYLVPIDRPLAIKIPRLLVAPDGPERAALFFTMGRGDAHLKRYVTYLKTRAYAIDLWKNSEYAPDVWDAVRGKNIKVIDEGEEVRQRLAAGETSIGVNQGYVPIPY